MSLVAFLIAALVLAVTPGPSITYVVARTVAGGRSEGLASCIGTGIGGLLHVLAAALGLSQWVLLGSVCVVLNTLADVTAVFAAQRLLSSGPARAARARLLTRASGVTMMGLGAFLALAQREVSA